jgi:hypothetical protein
MRREKALDFILSRAKREDAPTAPPDAPSAPPAEESSEPK